MVNSISYFLTLIYNYNISMFYLDTISPSENFHDTRINVNVINPLISDKVKFGFFNVYDIVFNLN